MACNNFPVNVKVIPQVISLLSLLNIHPDINSLRVFT